MARSSRDLSRNRQPAPRTERPKVLVLDDHPNVRSVVGEMLHEHGYEPVSASTVDEATRLLTKTAVSALILDVKLPGGQSGLDLLETTRRRPNLALVPAVVMTGAMLTEDERQKVTRLQAYLLHKPEGLTALFGLLNKITGAEAGTEG